MKRVPLEFFCLLYFIGYVPDVVLTRWLATVPSAALGRPLVGLEILPSSIFMSALLVYAFAWATGWWKSAHSFQLGAVRLPRPTRWTFLSGCCCAFFLVTVPLSFTFKGVSIPFIQLLMRGDVLIVAPLVDLLAGRKVRWFSWTALVLAAIGIACTLKARGGFYLPPLAIFTVVSYTLAYFGRLMIMTRVAKTDDPDVRRGYYVEEQLVCNPIALVVLAAIGVSSLAGPHGALSFGFVGVWTNDQFPWLVVLSGLLFMASVLAATILLDKRENTFCVPMERSASILAGIAGTYWLFLQFHQPAPTPAELFGATLLIVAIVILSFGPRWSPASAVKAPAEA